MRTPVDAQRRGEGGAAALESLYAEHGAMVTAYVTRMLRGDRARAEDVMQETLLRAWQNADRLEQTSVPVRAWLVRVAHNVVVDGIRAARARPAEAPGASPEGSSDMDDTENLLNSLAVTDALRRLAPEHRAVLTHLYYLGSSVSETARALEIPPGTVKSRAFYGLRKLRQFLDAPARVP
jgi:RNA polymerase sigma-70 factor, ECF subfamily